MKIAMRARLLLLLFCLGLGATDENNVPGCHPMPTLAQQRYADHEIAVMITFNMGTYFPRGNQDPACHVDNWVGPSGSGNPSSFNPYLLDTDQWGQVFQRLGAKHAVLTAKHGCGFLLWPSQVPLLNAVSNTTQTYTYAVGRPESAIQVDVIGEFVKSMRKYDIGVGFYYSLKNNFYLNMKDHHFDQSSLLPGQINVTLEHYQNMALEHLRELWTNYGDLTEVWFDGGYSDSVKERLKAMLDELQPNSIVWRGQGITNRTVAWVGTESGFPQPDEIYSTGCSILGGSGEADSCEWCPKGCDTTLQESDEWFYVPEVPIRSLETMMNIYHQTVGRNGVMELDVAVDTTGRIRYDHAQRYQQMGDYIRVCYGTPLKSWTNISGYAIDLRWDQPVTIDRIILREDQWQGGQRVRQYQVDVREEIASQWKVFSLGNSIGNKRIDFFNATTPHQPVPVHVRSLRFHALAAIGTPLLREISIFAPCPDTKEFVIATEEETSLG